MGKAFWETYWTYPRPEEKQFALAKGCTIQRDMENATFDKLGSISAAFAAVAKAIAMWTPILDKTYRVLIDVNTGKVEVVCLGIDSVDHEAEGIYQQVEDLPMWMQEKLAVLSMMEVNPPQEEVNGVGIRIDGNTYWIVKS